MDTKDLYQAKREVEKRIAAFIREQTDAFAEESGIGVKAISVEVVRFPAITYAFLNEPGERRLPPQPASEQIIAEVHLAI